MRAPRVLLLGLGLGLAACGSEATPPLPTNSKTLPTLEERYQRRDLPTWRALAGDLAAEERAAQAWALGVLEKDPLASVHVLLGRLEDEDPSVRLAAAVALGRLAPPSERAAAALRELLRAPQEPLRRHARLALGRLGAAAVGPLGAALEAEGVSERWAAVEILGRLGEAGQPHAATVARLAREDPVPAIRRQARFSLPRMGPAGLEASLRMLRDEDPTVRAEVAAALSHAGAGVVGAMAALLSDADEDVAARAAGVLADQGAAAEPALEALVRALEREGPVRFNAAEALIGIGAAAAARLRTLGEGVAPGVAAIARYVLDEIDSR